MLRGGAKVNDIKRWLEDLDLGRYVEAFLANAIDIELLPDLDEADLEKIWRRLAWLTGTVLPAIEAFDPDLVIISAGFDAHEADPLASLRFTTADFAWATTELTRIRSVLRRPAGVHARRRLRHAGAGQLRRRAREGADGYLRCGWRDARGIASI